MRSCSIAIIETSRSSFIPKSVKAQTLLVVGGFALLLVLKSEIKKSEGLFTGLKESCRLVSKTKLYSCCYLFWWTTICYTFSTEGGFCSFLTRLIDKPRGSIGIPVESLSLWSMK